MLGLLLAFQVIAAEVGQDNPTLTAAPWPEADTLFHQNPLWLGGDDAYSIDLGAGRILWLFADSFIATRPGADRRDSVLARNSVAIQMGHDPSSASMTFFWQTKAGKPASFFPESQKFWYWPGHGVRLGKTLLLFLMKVRNTNTGLGFEVFGSQAVEVANPDDDPPRWRIRLLPMPENHLRVIVGSASVLADDDFVYAFSAQEGEGSHDVYLLRWPLMEANRGNLRRPHWWDSHQSRWIAPPGSRSLKKPESLPEPLLKQAQTEFTVHFDPRRKQFVQIQTVGFGGTSIGARRATQITGPWTPLQTFYRPAESDQADNFVYAGKAHPSLRPSNGNDEMILTYVVNNRHFERLIENNQIYYPRFLKARWVESSAPLRTSTPQ